MSKTVGDMMMEMEEQTDETAKLDMAAAAAEAQYKSETPWQGWIGEDNGQD